MSDETSTPKPNQRFWVKRDAEGNITGTRRISAQIIPVQSEANVEEVNQAGFEKEQEHVRLRQKQAKRRPS